MAVHKEVSFLPYLLVLGMLLLVSSVKHVDAKACTKECGNLGYGICPRSQGSPTDPICTNCCSGYKGCNYYSADGTFICQGESDPKNPKACPLNCDPHIAYSKCPRSKGKTIIYPTGCTTCCTGYKGCYYFDQEGKFVCEGESDEPKACTLECDPRVAYMTCPNHKAKHHKKVLLNFCEEDNQGKAVLDLIIHISKTTLISYPGERDLQALTCHELLHGLVRRKNVCVHLVELDSWRELANAFANEQTLFSLNAAHQRSLAQTLVLSASGMKTPEASSQYVRNLTNHMAVNLVELSSRSDLKCVAEQPDIILLVSCLLERLRGAASATEPRTQRAIYEMGYSVLNPLLMFMEVYKHESTVVYLLLRFVVDWVDGQIIYLEARETAIVVGFCMRLLQLYSSHNIGKISLSISSSLRSEADTERYKDLRVVLQLLASLCSKDLVDFSSEPIEAHGTNICQVVYMGLHIVTPLISLDLLKYPKLCHDYFSLLSHMLEVYPQMITQLNGEAFVHIIKTLDFGLSQDAEVVDLCLRAIKGLASFHYKQKSAGEVGLGLHASGYKDHTGNFQEGILGQFLRSLLQFLLFQDYSTDLVGSAADALLPLILCEQSLYQKLGSELIESQSETAFRSRLTNALQSLTSSNSLSSTLDRPNYQKFRKNLHNFLTEVRGFLRKI